MKINELKKRKGIIRTGAIVFSILFVTGVIIAGIYASSSEAVSTRKEFPSTFAGVSRAKTGLGRIDWEDLWNISDPRLRFTRLLEEYDGLVYEPGSYERSSFGSRSEEHPSHTQPLEKKVLSVYLGRHLYERGEAEAASVFLSKKFEEEELKRIEDEKNEDVRRVYRHAQLLSLFHSAQRAFERGNPGKSEQVLARQLFPLLEEVKAMEFRGWAAELVEEVEGDASSLAANIYIRSENKEKARAVYSGLWDERGTEIGEEMFLSYLLLLLEEEKKKVFSAAVRRWTAERPFNPDTYRIYFDFYERSGLSSFLLIERAERAEYVRPSLTKKEYIELIDEMSAAFTESEEPLTRLLRLYAFGEWKDAADELSRIVHTEEGEYEMYKKHRFFRYLSAVIRMKSGKESVSEVNKEVHKEEAIAEYLELQPFFGDFQYYYLYIWEDALEAEKRRTAQAVAALRSAIRRGPRSPLANRAREILWEVHGPGDKDGGGSADMHGPGDKEGGGSAVRPLLKEELERIADFIRMGADPILLDPVVELLRYEDNIHTFNAELAIRAVRDLYGIRSYLMEKYRRADGRLEERLGSILRQ